MKIKFNFFVVFIIVVLGANFPSFAQCNCAWQYKVPIIVNNLGATAQTNYQVSITMNTQALVTAGKMLATGDDIRFTDSLCNNLPYWIETGTMNTTATIIWINVSYIPASGFSTIRLYYGNGIAASGSNGNATFILFDDFTGSTVDITKWTVVGTAPTVGGGNISFSAAGWSLLESISSFPGPYISEMKVNSCSGYWPNMAQANNGNYTAGATMFANATTMFMSNTYSTPGYSAVLNTVSGLGATVGMWSIVRTNTSLIGSWPGGSATYGGVGSVANQSTAFGLLDYSTGTLSVDFIFDRKYYAAGTTQNIGAEVANGGSAITGVTTVCTGATTTLSNAASGGTWASSNTAVATIASTGVVTGVLAGTTLISYTVGSCIATTVVTVNTQPLPITGNAPICQTFTNTLSDPTPGGVWSSIMTTVATISVGGVVTGGNVGTSLVSYTIGSCAVTTIVTVNTQPAGIAGGLGVCQGGTTTLSDATAGGAWSSVNPGIGSISAGGVVTGASLGTATISYTIGSCASGVVVTVNTQPAPITGNVPICQTFTNTLADPTPGGVWSSVTTTVATISAGGVVTGGNVGTSLVSYTIGSCAVTTIVTVNTQPVAIAGGLSICQGSTSTLTDATGGGVWSSVNPGIGSVSAGGVVTGVSLGTATISYTIGSCASGVVVTVNTQPAPITGNAPICQTFTNTLADPTPGGVWSSVTTTVATISAGGVVTGGNVGTSLVSYTIGSCAVTTIVTVNTQPVAIAGGLSICQGSTSTLTDATGGGVWSSVNPGIGSVSAGGVVTGVSLGTATISYTIGSCASGVVVTVNTQPAPITGNVPICQTFTNTLADPTPGGVWSSVTTTVATISAGGVVTGGNVGTSLVSYAIGSCAVTTIVTVNTQPVAIAGGLSICQGSTTALTDATGGGVWSSINPATGSVSSGGVVTGIAVGTATISYTLGSCAVSKIVTVNTQPVPITGNAPICQTFSNTLSDATAGGVWSSVTTTVATISAGGVVTGGNVGTSLVFYTIGSCAVTTIVTVNTQPVAIAGALSICQGSTTALTDGTGGGVWSSINPGTGSVSAGGVVTGVAVGTATISYTIGNCAVSSVVSVNTQPVPIAGNGPLCQYFSMALSDATGGGVWSSVTPPVAAISAGGNVTGGNVGTSTILYTIGSCIATAIVTINTQPVGISGALTVCQGYATSLTDATGGGTWSSSNTSVGTISTTTGSVTGVSAGTTTITYTLPAGCFSTIMFTVNPLPAPITGLPDGCIGFSTVLGDATPGGIWSSSTPAIASIGSASGFVSWLVNGTTTITYTIGTGCYITRVETVDPSPAAIASAPVICAGTPSVFTNAAPGGNWSCNLPGIAAIGGASGIVIGIAPGSATVSYTLPTGCYVTASLTVNSPPLPVTGLSSVCAGNSIYLTETVTGGVWTCAGGTGTAIVNAATGTVTGQSAGTIVVSYTTATCSPAIFPVTVNPLPLPITGIGSVCQGATISLHEVTTGGVWSTSSSAVSVSSSGVVAGVIPGSGATISYTLPTGCYATAPVLVDYLPGPIHGIDSVCQGSSTILSDAVSGGAWSSSDGTIATAIAFTGEVIGAHAGTVHITYTLISGCYVDTAFKVIAPLPASLSVTTNAADSVCAGTSVLFTAHPVNGGPGATFTWKVFVPGGPSGTGLTFPYAPTHWDYVECTMVPGGICALPDSVKAAVTMNVFPDVTPLVTISSNLPNDTITYLGELVTFHSDLTSGGVSPSYQWYRNGIAIPGATSTSYSTHVYNVNDTFQLKVVATSYCDPALTQFSNGIIIYSNSYLAVKTVLSANGTLSLYPNPNNGSFTLTGKSISDKEMDIEVADMLGRIVYTGKTTPVNGVIHAEIALPGEIADGTYMLRVHSETETGVFHFVIGK